MKKQPEEIIKKDKLTAKVDTMYNNEQIAAYLNRIRYEGPLTVSKETLDGLIYAHQCNIPFENLDVYDFHKEIVLDEESLFDKFVNRHRGGYCFETNGFFYHMLKAIGFEAYPCLCRVLFGLKNPQENFIDHRATIVHLDGRRYFCEAGIGGAMPAQALELPPARIRKHAAEGMESPDTEEVFDGCQEGFWQEMKGEYFCVREIERNWYGTIRRVRLESDIYDDPMDRKERLEVMFCDAAAHEIDFRTLNHYLSQSDCSMFRQKRVINLRTPEGYRALTNQVYREVVHGERSERVLTPEEIPQILKEKFGLEITKQLRVS